MLKNFLTNTLKLAAKYHICGKEQHNCCSFPVAYLLETNESLVGNFIRHAKRDSLDEKADKLIIKYIIDAFFGEIQTSFMKNCILPSKQY